MRTITLFAEFRGRRYMMEDKYIRSSDAERAGKLLGGQFPKASFYITDREIDCDGGDAFAFAYAYEARYPTALEG